MSELVLQTENSPGALGAGLVAIFVDANTGLPSYVGNDGIVHAMAGGAAGSNDQVLYNNAGGIGASANLTFNATSNGGGLFTTRRGMFGSANGDANPLAGDDPHWVTITNDPSVVAGGAGSGYQLFRVNSYGNTGYGGNVHFFRYRGTANTPLAVQSGDTFQSFGFRGHDGSAVSQSAGNIAVVATQNWNASAHGLQMIWGITANGTTTRVNGMVLSGSGLDVQVGNISLSGAAMAQRAMSINSQSANYTLVLADAGNAVYHPASDANPRTFTIPSNANVAFGNGEAVMFINLSASNVTIAIQSDTMQLMGGNGGTGSRTLQANGVAVATKLASTTWMISGTNLS